MERSLADAGLDAKVRWEGYGKAHDTWEPMDSFIDMSVITMFEHELKSGDCLRAAKQSTSASVESVRSMPKVPVQTSALTSAVRRVGRVQAAVPSSFMCQ